MIRAIPDLESSLGHCVVNTATDSDSWRKKYFDSLSSLETEQRQFRVMETTLKRLAGRLCSASLGQSSRLDEQIKKLQTALRREASSDELEQITPALTDAIQALDQSTTASSLPAPVTVAAPAKAQPDPPGEATLDDERIRAILSALLVELRRDAELSKQADTLDARLSSSMTAEQLPEVLASLAEMVGLRIKRIETARQEIAALLSHMVGKLDEIGQFVAYQNQSQSQSQASSETLNLQLAGEMKAMGESVEATGDLQQIRTQVRSRLDSIDRHLQEFRQREAALANSMRARNEQMRARIVELEAEANRLHSQVKDEQRLSTLDTLTQIPNRLGYEKRIEDELQRWRRFKQPVCVAVWDVDLFKRINDAYGHRAGDRVLRAVAECLAGRIRATDFVARYGGEEFVMILPGTKLDDAVRVIDEMRNAIARIGFHFRGTPVSITISIGVTALLAADSVDAAFDRADKALYRAKESGRNRCVST
jgi:diguanylate cyclase